MPGERGEREGGERRERRGREKREKNQIRTKRQTKVIQKISNEKGNNSVETETKTNPEEAHKKFHYPSPRVGGVAG